MDRRGALQFLGSAAAMAAVGARGEVADANARVIPASGERIPVVGLGTWLTFDVGGADSAAFSCSDFDRSGLHQTCIAFATSAA